MVVRVSKTDTARKSTTTKKASKSKVVGRGLWRDSTGKRRTLPYIRTSTNKSGDKNEKPKKTSAVRGKEVTVRDSAKPAQICYGRFRVGGTYTFLDTGQNSAAYASIGDSSAGQFLVTAKESGANGNTISVNLLCTGNNSTLTTSVTTNEDTGIREIVCRLRSTGGVTNSTVGEVVSAFALDAGIVALVTTKPLVADLNAWMGGTDSAQLLSGGGGTWLDAYVTLTCHEIDAIEALYLDDRVVTFGSQAVGTGGGPNPVMAPAPAVATKPGDPVLQWTPIAHPDPRWAVGTFLDHVFMAIQPGTDTQEVQPDLHCQTPAKWTDAHRQRGFSGATVILVWSSSLFADGLPQMGFLIRGKKCRSSRDNLDHWTQNPAFIAADYITNTVYGMKYDWSTVDYGDLTVAADACDAAGYELNGLIDTSRSHQDVLSDIAEAMAGDIVFQNGKWHFFPGVAKTPVMALTADNRRGQVKIQTLLGASETYSGVSGTFTSPDHDWEETDYPTVRNTYYAEQDGGENLLDLPLSLVTDPLLCQRIAKIRLEQNRQPMIVTYPIGPEGIDLTMGDWITLYDERYFGTLTKVFEVSDTDIAMDPVEGIGVELTLRETAAAVFDWGEGAPSTMDLAPNTNLPDPRVVAPLTYLTLQSGTDHLDKRADGTIFSRICAYWIRTDNLFVHEGGHVEVQYKKSEEDFWRVAGIIAGDSTHTYILDVLDSIEYDVRIRPINVMGAFGDWATVYHHLVIGKTAPPDDVKNLGASFGKYGINLGWAGVDDLDLREYVVHEMSLDNLDWPGTLLGQTRSTAFNIATTSAGDYYFMVKAIDTSGNYSLQSPPNDVALKVSILSPIVSNLTGEISAGDLILSWESQERTFAISEYEVGYSTTSLGRTTNKSMKIPVDFSGDRTYWVKAKDIYGNGGDAVSTTITIQLPANPTSFTTYVIDNNVLFKITPASVTSLPIVAYRIFKGDVLGTAELIGEFAGTFTTYFEMESGIYTYWARTVDTAGNYSTGSLSVATVSEPPDFKFRGQTDFDLNDALTITNCAVTENVIYAPVTAETWTQHFANHSWLTPDAQIAAGYPLYAQPTPTTAVYEQVWECDTTVNESMLINFDYRFTTLAGTVTVVPQVSYKATAGAAWTDGPSNSRAVVGSGFLFVKVKLTITGSTDLSFGRLDFSKCTLSVKRKSDAGMGTSSTTVDLTDISHKVFFATTFIDIDSLQITPTRVAEGTFAPLIPIYDFEDTPYPTYFYVYIFNMSGDLVEVPFSWEARGI